MSSQLEAVEQSTQTGIFHCPCCPYQQAKKTTELPPLESPTPGSRSTSAVSSSTASPLLWQRADHLYSSPLNGCLNNEFLLVDPLGDIIDDHRVIVVDEEAFKEREEEEENQMKRNSDMEPQPPVEEDAYQVKRSAKAARRRRQKQRSKQRKVDRFFSSLDGSNACLSEEILPGALLCMARELCEDWEAQQMMEEDKLEEVEYLKLRAKNSSHTSRHLSEDSAVYFDAEPSRTSPTLSLNCLSPLSITGTAEFDLDDDCSEEFLGIGVLAWSAFTMSQDSLQIPRRDKNKISSRNRFTIYTLEALIQSIQGCGEDVGKIIAQTTGLNELLRAVEGLEIFIRSNQQKHADKILLAKYQAVIQKLWKCGNK